MIMAFWLWSQHNTLQEKYVQLIQFCYLACYYIPEYWIPKKFKEKRSNRQFVIN